MTDFSRKLAGLKLPTWMNKGDPPRLLRGSVRFWEQVYEWITMPLRQLDPLSCAEPLLNLLAWERDITRFDGEPLELFRQRVSYAFVNAQDAGEVAGFKRIFERLGVGRVELLERQLQYEWDVILLRINDTQLTRNQELMMKLVRQYGRTCRRYFYDLVNQERVTIQQGQFDNDARCFIARADVNIMTIGVQPEALALAPGETAFVRVDVMPADAADRTFRVVVSDASALRVDIVSGGVKVTALAYRTAEITLTLNARAISTKVQVTPVPATKFVMRIDSLSRPLFYADQKEDFTIDYGDGVDSDDYRIAENSADGMGWVYPTRALTVGETYTITVKRSETVRFFASSGTGVSYTFNSLLEIISVAGNRPDLLSFARGMKTLIKVHAGAFDNLSACYDIRFALFNCSGLVSLPDGLFDKLPLRNAARSFDGCSALEVDINRLFASERYEELSSVYQMFSDCTKITGSGLALINALPAVTIATDKTGAFRNCTALVDYADIPAQWR